MHRIALLVNGTDVSGLVEDLIDWSETQPDIEIAALIIHPLPVQTRGRALIAELRRSGLYAVISTIAFMILQKIERRLFLTPSQRALLAARPIGERVPNHLVITPEPSKSGLIHRFSDEDVERVRQLNVDLLVRCGSGILQGKILSAAPLGIVSMHHGDNRINRGGPAGFWEVLDRHPTTGFVVQRLEAELDGGEVLYRGSFLTRPNFASNQAWLLERSNAFLKKTIFNVLEKRTEVEPRLIYFDRLYRRPKLHNLIRYAWQVVRDRISLKLRMVFGRLPRWSVSYLFSDWRGAVLWKARTIANPPGHFLADPFVASEAGRRHLLLEDFRFDQNKGVIAAYRIEDDRSATPLGVVLEEPFHLSFPFLFRHEGSLYMIPESAANRDIRLYRCASFPLQWALHSVLMQNVVAVDTMVFTHGDRWWMMTNINGLGRGPNDSEVHVFHAETPFGPWLPHAGNPVILDAMRGRNGGILIDETGIYRVAQRPGFGLYGRGASIFRIEALTPETYREVKVQDVDPLFRPGIEGVHHFHQDDGLLAFDHVRN